MLGSAKEINATQYDTGKDMWELVRNPLMTQDYLSNWKYLETAFNIY
jgi:hypothetical protein